MAETFAQRRNAANAALRRMRAMYRRADSQGELLEREVDRLISRKTIVTPGSMVRLNALYVGYVNAVEAVEVSLTDANIIIASYV